MKKPVLWIFIIIQYNIITPLPAKNIYVDGMLSSNCIHDNYSIKNRDCSGNDGCAYRNIQDGVNAAGAGDFVLIREGEYRRKDAPDNINGVEFHNSGSEKNFITITSYNKEDVCWIGGQFSIYGDYINLDGLSLIKSEGAGKNNIYIESNWVIIRNCYLDGNGQTSSNIKSNIAAFNHHLLVENCTLVRSKGISFFTDQMDYQVFRNNVIEASGIVGADPGAIRHGLMENNYIRAEGPYPGSCLKLRWGNSVPVTDPNFDGYIIRRNVFVDGDKYNILLASANGGMVYNNTLYIESAGKVKEKGSFYMQRDYVALTNEVGPNKNNVIKNNIICSTVNEPIMYINQDMTLDFADQQIDYNLYFKTSGTDYLVLGGIRTYNFPGLKEDSCTWARFGYDVNSISTNPQLRNMKLKAYPYNFKPVKSSPVIDNGTYLTQTVGNGSGTSFKVTDSRYFTDGMDGLIEGDVIRLGKFNNLTITDIDYTDNILTVSSKIKWKDGDPVSLSYKGKKPDIGAYEFGDESIIIGNSFKNTEVFDPYTADDPDYPGD